MNKNSLSIKGFLVLLIVLSEVNILTSQTPLSEVSDFGFHQQLAYSIVELDSNRIFIAGQALPKGEGSRRDLFFSKVGLDLIPIDYSILQTSSETITNGCKELLFNNGKLYKTGSDDFSGGPAFIAEYDIVNNVSVVHHAVRDTFNNLEWVVYSSILLNSESEITSILVNDLGVLWVQILDTDISNRVIKQVRYSEPGIRYTPIEIKEISCGYIVYGSQFDGVVSNNFICKLDDELNVLKLVKLENTNYWDSFNEGTEDVDGNFVFTNNEHLGEFERWRSVAIKIDTNLNLIWEMPVGPSEFTDIYSYNSSIVASHSNDGYIICGTDNSRDSITVFKGQVSKISTLGDSIWHRKYLPLTEENQNLAELQQIIQSADGNYLLAGYSGNRNSLTDSIFRKVWLMKIDEDGHIVNKTSSASGISYKDNNIRIFPNPTADYLYIEHDAVEEISYSLYDSRGQMVLQKKKTEPYTTYILDFASYPNGIYYLHIINPTGHNTVEKILVEH